MRSDLKKLNSFTLDTSENHLIRNFLRNGHVRVNERFCMKLSIHYILELILNRVHTV